jgi:serine/threonine protein kinase/tetratricopeptide (TPR) repeat protein
MPIDPARVEEVFDEAVLRADPADRSAYLDEACCGDCSLRERVETLLAALAEAGNFLKLPNADDVADPFVAVSEGPGTTIGRYKLLEQIGEGGFGVVFMAEQEHPVRRRVALKIIKLGMDTRQVVARFEAERQALAMMDHANIAKVFDAGTTDTGRPYFVMELVKGAPITKYCDEHNLNIPQRLALFAQVCMAVQHAHQKGIIHRDLKPSNVLVTLHDERAVPKIIDFGVAKATQVKLTDKTLFTGFRQLIGTPTYMSPEQAQWSGLDVDTRTDIYSLGVLLYELLTGTTPFDARQLMDAAYEELQRIVREVDPPKPSTRISELKETLPTVAEHRATEPRKLDSAIRGDLDWITMKALEKDRARRYESASALAEDIMHHLADEPVSAAAPSKTYRLRKFVERNKVSVIAASAVLAALVIGMIGTTIGLVGQSRQRAEAEAAREELKAVNDFLTDDLLGGADPGRLPDKAVRDQIVKAMIDPAASKVRERFKDQPLVEAAVQMGLANSYDAVGRSDLALKHASQALEIRHRLLGRDHPDTLVAARLYASLLRTMGRLNEAAPMLQTMLAGHRQAFGDDHEATVLAMTSTAMQLQLQGRFAEAEPLYREALERSRRLPQHDQESTVMSLNNLGHFLIKQGNLSEAEPLLREAVESGRQVLGETHRGTIRAIDNLGLVLSDQGKLTEAESVWREGLAISQRVLGDDDPFTLSALNNMVGLLMEQGKFDEAEPLARESLKRHQRVFGEDHPEALVSLTNLGLFLRRQGKLEEAEQVSTEALSRERQVCGEDHPDTLYAITNMGTLCMAQKRFEKAETFLLDARERAQRVLPENHPLIADSIFNLADLRRYQDRPDEAKQLYEQALERRRRLLGETHPYTNNVLLSLAILLYDQGNYAQVLPMFQQVLTNFTAVFGPEHWQVGVAHMHVARCLTALHRYSEAEPELMEADRIIALAQDIRVERRRKLCETGVALYEGWDKAAPGNGYAAKTDQWRGKLTSDDLPETTPVAGAGR